MTPVLALATELAGDTGRETEHVEEVEGDCTGGMEEGEPGMRGRE